MLALHKASRGLRFGKSKSNGTQVRDVNDFELFYEGLRGRHFWAEVNDANVLIIKFLSFLQNQNFKFFIVFLTVRRYFQAKNFEISNGTT